MTSKCCMLERAAMENGIFTFVISQGEVNVNWVTSRVLRNNMGRYFEDPVRDPEPLQWAGQHEY